MQCAQKKERNEDNTLVVWWWYQASKLLCYVWRVINAMLMWVFFLDKIHRVALSLLLIRNRGIFLQNVSQFFLLLKVFLCFVYPPSGEFVKKIWQAENNREFRIQVTNFFGNSSKKKCTQSNKSSTSLFITTS